MNLVLDRIWLGSCVMHAKVLNGLHRCDLLKAEVPDLSNSSPWSNQSCSVSAS